ncbi:hypothetical protein WICPIJ_001717 [Wickerhamomyces pijperi]|uniref:PUM-HD domain-containing protein n=1 Tax=Wickerhamomyces pijperi TaxID=599730 RepID=A0A9P8QD76_WICPI|nr:hypothetical protein WICPIJ_001717 [Wickerhamomyces pijperi]
MNSIVEPMTPPDYSHGAGCAGGAAEYGEQFRFPNDNTAQSYLASPYNAASRAKSVTTPDNFSRCHQVSPVPGLGSGSGSGSASGNYNISLNNTSPINTSIGGNKFRTRFKSLSSMDDLDHKFSNIVLGQLQPSPINKESINPTSIGQLAALNQTIAATAAATVPLTSIQNLQQLAANNQAAIPKNLDELNLVPIESLDILKLSVDQYGCRFLQKRIEVDSKMVDVVFNKVFNNLLDLIVDPFGNYLIQKLVDYLLPYQKDLMVEKIHAHLFAIAINQYGTRSLQKIIDSLSNGYQMDLVVKGLQVNDTLNNMVDDNNVVKLIKDLNGNHVIQKCIYKFPPEKFQFIIDSICISNNIVRISTHKHGCCVLQKLLNNSDFSQILKISKVLLVYLDDLINDQFGNYIIQFLFELNFLKSSEKINFLIDEFFNKIFNNLVRLSCLKFSSNVIEKFIKILKTKKNYVYLTEIIKLTNSNFEVLIKDKFGNYVIQTLLDQFYDANELSFEMANLIANIKKFLPLIKTAPYGKKMQLKVQQLEACHSTTAQPHMFNYNYHSAPTYYDYNAQHSQTAHQPAAYYNNVQMNHYNVAMNYRNNYSNVNQGAIGNFINTSQ